MYIKVHVATDEQALFGNEPAPESYDIDSLLSMVKREVAETYPNSEVEVFGGHASRVDVDNPWPARVEDVVFQIVHDTWQDWLKQYAG